MGTHGIIIEFFADSKRYSGTFLPDVSKEQGWTREDTVHALVRKTGYRKKVTTALLESISTTRYQSSKESMLYREYKAARGR